MLTVWAEVAASLANRDTLDGRGANGAGFAETMRYLEDELGSARLAIRAAIVADAGAAAADGFLQYAAYLVKQSGQLLM